MVQILTIDSGNTYIKWGLHDYRGWVCQGRVKQDDSVILDQSWQSLPEPAFIIGSNVADKVVRETLTRLCSRWKTKSCWITAVQSQCGVRNLYSDPAQLGSDRWASLVAAWNQQLQASLVINIGTAMTIDVLSDTGSFLGGVILPGPKLMFEALKAHTAIPYDDSGLFQQLPDCTDDAIYSGVVQSLVGAIERMKHVLNIRLGYSVQNCILSGGASSLILPHLGTQAKVVNNLVLEGLLLIANDQLSLAEFE